MLFLFCLVSLWATMAPGLGEEALPNVFDIPADLAAPPVVAGEPAAGKRVRVTTEAWHETSVYHALYLPVDWKAGASFPVFVEFPGNGGYLRGPDVSYGTPDGCSLGYGLTEGRGVIWLCLPFVDTDNGPKQNSTAWWGSVEETKRYCLATVREVCERFGGDPRRVVLGGFSRGAIACNFIGLHDDEISKLWRGFFCHSHYDGVQEKWPYAGADRASALTRLKRLRGRPQWISQEKGGVVATEKYLKEAGISGDFAFVPLPFANHTDQWVLRNVPERRLAREWLKRILAQ